MYADVEKLLTGLLSTATGVRAVTDLPADFTEIIRVARVAGADLQPTVDEAIVDVEAFAPTRAQASTLAEQVRDYLRFTLPGTHGVTKVRTVAAPVWRPYDNTAVRRFGGSYALTLH